MNSHTTDQSDLPQNKDVSKTKPLPLDDEMLFVGIES